MNLLEDIAGAVALVKQQPSGERTAVVKQYLAGQVNVGPPIKGFHRRKDTIPPGLIRGQRGGFNEAGAALLHRRALLVSELSRQKIWP